MSKSKKPASPNRPRTAGGKHTPAAALVEQRAELHGTDHVNVQAGRDAHVVLVRPDHSSVVVDSRRLAKIVGPILLVALLNTLLRGEWLLGLRIAACAAVVVWMTWAAINDTRLSLMRRVAVPVIAVVYTVALTVFTALPDLSWRLHIAVPALLWVCAAATLLWLIEPERRKTATRQYAGVTVIGVNVVMIGGVITAALDHQALYHVAWICAGIAGIGVGVAMTLDHDRLLLVAGNCCVVAAIGGIAIAFDHDLPVALLVIGLVAIAVPVMIALFILIGFGIGALFGRVGQLDLSKLGLGVAGIGVGVAELVGHETLYGVAMFGSGVAAVGMGVAAIGGTGVKK